MVRVEAHWAQPNRDECPDRGRNSIVALTGTVSMRGLSGSMIIGAYARKRASSWSLTHLPEATVFTDA